MHIGIVSILCMTVEPPARAMATVTRSDKVGDLGRVLDREDLTG